MPLQSITHNLAKTADVRHDRMGGRDYLVVPMVMITEGVHNGSNGPLFYPGDELAKAVPVWNNKPTVIYHPVVNGEGVSACSPDVITNRGVGLVMNTKFEEGKLKAEAWLEESRLKEIDDRVLDAITNNRMMEVSTGLFTDNELKEGEFNGTAYKAIARNHKPDHLAILPDQIGACSIVKGAGLLRNNAGGTEVYTPDQKILLGIIAKATGLVANELSQSNISSALYTYVRKNYGDEAWLEDVYSSFFIYVNKGQLFKLDYEEEDGLVSVSGTPTKVKRVTEYRTVDGDFVGNATGINPLLELEPIMAAPTTERKEAVTKLIANSKGRFSEEDRAHLEGVDPKFFDRLVKNEEAANKPAETKPEAPANPPAATVPAPAVTNTEAKVPTTADYLKSLPPEVQSIIINSMKWEQSQKEELITKITANSANIFTKDQLLNRNLEELRGLAALAGSGGSAPTVESDPIGYYFGAGGAPVHNSHTPIAAANAPVMNFEPLAIPSMDPTKK